ncbi:MAG: hypothetical protein ACRDO4_07230 [Nocardioides sp.]
MPSPRVRLAAGLRVTDRGDGSLQVGLHPDRRLLLPDDAPVRALLTRLRHPADPGRMSESERSLVDRLTAAGLLEQEHAATPEATATSGTVQILAPDPAAALTRRLLADAGLTESRGGGDAALTLVVSVGAEPRRTDLDAIVQTDRPHLLVTSVAGRTRIGPCVVPGLTACLRCLDEHQADRDPRHVRVVDQHVVVDHTDRPRPGDLALALAWAVRDVAVLLDGERPTTWSASVTLRPEGPHVHEWRRHPRCGCAWGDLLAG